MASEGAIAMGCRERQGDSASGVRPGLPALRWCVEGIALRRQLSAASGTLELLAASLDGYEALKPLRPLSFPQLNGGLLPAGWTWEIWSRFRSGHAAPAGFVERRCGR